MYWLLDLANSLDQVSKGALSYSFCLVSMLRFEQAEYRVSETLGSVMVYFLLNFPVAADITFLLKAKDITATSENLIIQ